MFVSTTPTRHFSLERWLTPLYHSFFFPSLLSEKLKACSQGFSSFPLLPPRKEQLRISLSPYFPPKDCIVYLFRWAGMFGHLTTESRREESFHRNLFPAFIPSPRPLSFRPGPPPPPPPAGGGGPRPADRQSRRRTRGRASNRRC